MRCGMGLGPGSWSSAVDAGGGAASARFFRFDGVTQPIAFAAGQRGRRRIVRATKTEVIDPSCRVPGWPRRRLKSEATSQSVGHPFPRWSRPDLAATLRQSK